MKILMEATKSVFNSNEDLFAFLEAQNFGDLFSRVRFFGDCQFVTESGKN